MRCRLTPTPRGRRGGERPPAKTGNPRRGRLARRRRRPMSRTPRLADHTLPRRVTSYDECRFCEITGADCMERMKRQQAETATTDNF